MNNNIPNVIIPDNIDAFPKQHEIDVANILAAHYNCEVKFLQRIVGYKIKTPDIEMMGQLWEIKSPIGNSNKNAERLVKRAIRQSKNIIFDGRRTKVDSITLKNRLLNAVDNHHSIRKLIFITKESEVLELVMK